jgi:hypothetical protein
MGNPNSLAFGPGVLYIAPIGSTEPTDLVTGWPGAWTQLGYTDTGSTFSYDIKTDTVEVAEEFDPVKVMTTSREMMVTFNLAEITATNLKRSLNGGVITTGSGYVYFDPPAPSTEVRTMLGWQADDGTERWIFRQCFQTGKIDIKRQKGGKYPTLSESFACEKPAGVQPFRVIMAAPARQ